MILYLWTAVTRDAAALRGGVGVSDDNDRARCAAEAYLRAGQARLAYVEVAHTAMGAYTLNPVYMRTGEGWWAKLNGTGEAIWVPFTEACEYSAPARAVPAGPAGPGKVGAAGPGTPARQRGRL